MEQKELLRKLPSVDEVLKSPHGLKWLKSYPRKYILRAIRDIIAFKRGEVLEGFTPDVNLNAISGNIEIKIKKLIERRLKPVINATGVVIHTNLGRAPLPPEVLNNIMDVAMGYSNLEYNIEEGRRGERYDHIRWILKDITGAEDAVVVNNNTAAVLLCLSAIAKGREVIVSRGELIEIGGAFRIPDVMLQSGALLKEVGTTNKTNSGDYEDAVGEQTALLLKVHQSNYKVIGFTEDVSVGELVRLGKRKEVPVMFDLGSGCFTDLRPYGIYDEPVVHEVVGKGVDIVTFSGDKLLGGPQAGIIVGRKKLIERIAKHPLTRAVRIDKLTLAALEATLLCHADPEKAREKIPVLKTLLQGDEVIKRRARKIQLLIKRDVRNALVSIEKDESQAGGGSLPGVYLPTYVVRLKVEGMSALLVEQRLRRGAAIAVITRIRAGSVIIDARTIRDSEVKPLLKAIKEAIC
ncbi:MAG TPA: L-seryl-tRNA(Sec) selenium transferase [Nitrospirae bacterium]|nr:L-seryl-tRNA(Sec) selenium transferase [Nitrospirota bacterium]